MAVFFGNQATGRDPEHERYPVLKVITTPNHVSPKGWIGSGNWQVLGGRLRAGSVGAEGCKPSSCSSASWNLMATSGMIPSHLPHPLIDTGEHLRHVLVHSLPASHVWFFVQTSQYSADLPQDEGLLRDLKGEQEGCSVSRLHSISWSAKSLRLGGSEPVMIHCFFPRTVPSGQGRQRHSIVLLAQE